MKFLIPFLFLFVAITSFISIRNSNSGTVNNTNVAFKDTMSADREKYLTTLREQLKGKEDLPADSVFKNIKSLKGTSTDRVLSIMNGWGHSLGVTCKFCHDVNDWASEKSRNFNRTREMVELTTKLNKEILPNLKNFRQPVVMSCISCHNEMKEPPSK